MIDILQREIRHLEQLIKVITKVKSSCCLEPFPNLIRIQNNVYRIIATRYPRKTEMDINNEGMWLEKTIIDLKELCHG